MKTSKSATARKGCRRANRDLAEQLNAVAQVIRKHEVHLAALLPVYGWQDNSETVPPGSIELFDLKMLEARLKDASRRSEKVLEGELKKAKILGSLRTLAKPPSLRVLQDLARDFPHFTEVIDLIRQRVSLARVTPGQVFLLPPILLSGSPGVGKTAFVEALAKCLGQGFCRLDLAAATAGFALAGSHESWSSARHGAVWTLLQSPCASGVLMLEEIDKAAGSGSYPVLGSLYSLLEPVSAKHFKDEYIDLEVNASSVIVVATCNDPDLLEPALRSRFRCFTIPVPGPKDMPAIARSVYRQLRESRPWGVVFPPELPHAVLDRLKAATPRQLSRALEEAHARAAEDGRLKLQPDDIVIEDESRAATKPKLGFV